MSKEILYIFTKCYIKDIKEETIWQIYWKQLFFYAGIRKTAIEADKKGNNNGVIDTRSEFVAIFDYYNKTKPNDSNAQESLEDPSITYDMNRLRSAYAIFEEKESKKAFDEALKSLRNGVFKMPKDAQELMDILKSKCN